MFGQAPSEVKNKLSNLKNEEQYDRDMRVRIYSCAFCKFVEQTIGIENLEALDLKKYVFHMKDSHGLEP